MICFQKSHLEHRTWTSEKKKQELKLKTENLKGLKFKEIFCKN
jgi:hypothetical protein